MGNHSPSHYRRQGRNAYSRGSDPKQYVPYDGKSGGIMQASHWDDWMAGWHEAEKRDELVKVQEVVVDIEEDDKVEEFARLYNLAKERGLL